MSSYPDTPRPRDQRSFDAVRDVFERTGPNQAMTIEDLERLTGLARQDVNRGLHYYRNALTQLRQAGQGGRHAIVEEVGWYWLTNDEDEINKYYSRLLRGSATRSRTGLEQLRVLAAGPANHGKTKRARDALKNGERFTEDIGDLLADLNAEA